MKAQETEAHEPLRESDRAIHLADGRRLSLVEYGARDGTPAFFFHGWPGSRLDFAANDAAATAAGVRVIAVDRPGIGKSDPLVGRTVRDWPRDLEALADALGIARFAVLGFSFGGPYTRACAYALPERITRAGLVSCLGPLDERGAARRLPAPTRWGLAAARLAPLAARPMAWLAARQARGGTMIDQLAMSMPRADAEVLSRPDVATALGASLAECFRQGIGAATWDGVAVARGERIPLTAITTEVLLWHGELDRNDPVSMAKLQESRLRHAKARYYPGEGHLIFFSHIDDVLAGLTTDELSDVVPLPGGPWNRDAA